MSYDIGWEVVGDRALTEAEIDGIAKHVAERSEDIDGYDLYAAKVAQPEVQAFYSIHLTAEELESELPLIQLFAALGELKELLPAFEIRVADDYSAYEWDGGGFVASGEPGTLARPDVDQAQWEHVSRWSAKPVVRPYIIAPGIDIFSDTPVAASTAPSVDSLLERAESERYRGKLEEGHQFELARQPHVIGRVIESWMRAVEGPSRDEWEATNYFSAFASEPAMFDTLLAMLRAPPVNVDGYHDKELNSALNMLPRAKRRIDEAAAVLIACVRRDERARWRDRLIEALAECDTDAARAALMLDLAAGARPTSRHARALARHPHASSLLARVRDLPFGTRDVLDEWHRLDPAKGEPERRAMLEHPFWLVRWRAASVAGHDDRDEDLAAVWRTLKGAETSLRARDIEDFENNAANPSSRELVPLPPALAGLASTCTDHRRWAIGYVDERRRERDAPALALADELDEALTIRGYPRMRPRWTLWRKVMPAVPFESAARGDWARTHEIEDETLRDVALRGAEVVARRFPPPRLVLRPEEGELAERLVHAADKLGRQLLRLP